MDTQFEVKSETLLDALTETVADVKAEKLRDALADVKDELLVDSSRGEGRDIQQTIANVKVEGLVESLANKALVNNLAAWPTEFKAETLREFWQL